MGIAFLLRFRSTTVVCNYSPLESDDEKVTLKEGRRCQGCSLVPTLMGLPLSAPRRSLWVLT